MKMLLGRRVLIALLLSGVAIGLLPVVAYACSCVGGSPAAMLARHDAAFIGPLDSVRGGMFWGEATFRFTAKQWIKGNLGETVKINAPPSGASCGFELKEGDEAAIFVKIEGNRLVSGLCSTLDADTVRAHLEPKPFDKTRATILVAAGAGQGDRHIWLYDDQGRLAGAAADARGDWLEDLAMCPGGRTAVELWDGPRGVVVRDLRTLRVTRSPRVPRDIGQVWCDDADGNTLFGARRSPDTGDFDAVLSLLAPRTAVVRGAWTNVEVVGNHVVATVGREHTRLERISLKTGRVTTLHQSHDFGTEPDRVPAGIEGFAISPDQTRVAFQVTRYPKKGNASSSVFVYDLASGRAVAATHVPVAGEQVRWLDHNQLVLTSYEGAAYVLAAATLHIRTLLSDNAHWAAVTGAQGALLGMDGPRLVSVDPTSGEIRRLATIPVESDQHLIRLPRPLAVKAPARSALRPPAAPPKAAGPSVPTATSSRGPLEVAALAGAATALLALGLLALLGVRRRRA
jgi:hypothetical protein